MENFRPCREIGAIYRDNYCQFTVWAPFREQVDLMLISHDSQANKIIPMEKDVEGYWSTKITDIESGSLYLYQLDGELQFPDPASFYQPQGVHEPSHLVNHQEFHWQDESWNPLPLPEWIIYEIHVGTFTQQGDFKAIASRLPTLKALGINTIELMPVAQFPGERNWGYDGVYPFAVQNSYGGPKQLKELINTCHQQGFNVILDVVYNHFGPEGCYVSQYGPYLTDKYNTPWGKGLNYDDAYSNQVRNFIVNNALYWLREYHFDGLRIDAIHGIYDFSALHILAEIAIKVEELSEAKNKDFYLIAESDLNDVRVIQSLTEGGHGMASQWSDDFHHSLHTLLTGENVGYYQDFGKVEHLAKAIKSGFVYSGEYSPFRKRYHGNDASDRLPQQFVVCSQNHDQVGNRMLGERLSNLVSFSQLKLAAATLLLSPYIPLLFMGEEYGEDNPFLYFVNHLDADLVEAVREGRKSEFADFQTSEIPPDPASIETFKKSTLNWEKINQGKHQQLWQFYQKLITIRKKLGISANRKKPLVTNDENILSLNYQQQAIILLNFSSNLASWSLPEGNWLKILESENIEPSQKVMISEKHININPHNLHIYQKQ